MDAQNTFNARTDGWIVAILLTQFAVIAVLLAAVIAEGAAWSYVLLAVAICLPSHALIAWPFAAARYTATKTDLFIRSGPLKWRIRISGVERVTPTRSMAPPRDRQSFLEALQRQGAQI